MHFLCIFLLSLDIVLCISFFFFFNDTATTEIYTLSLHDALPIFGTSTNRHGTETHLPRKLHSKVTKPSNSLDRNGIAGTRSEEHTSELQSLAYLVCRLLLEKKNNHTDTTYYVYMHILYEQRLRAL